MDVGHMYIMIDTGSTGNFMSPAFTKVTGMNIFPLEQQLTLQLGCIGSHSKITHGGRSHIKIGSHSSKSYFNVVNIDRYDCILGIPFLWEHKAILNFMDQKIHIGDVKISLLEEVALESHQRQPVHIPRQQNWLPSPVRLKGPCKGSRGEGGMIKTPKKMSTSSKQQFASIKTKEKCLTESDIPHLRNQLFQKYKNWLRGMVQRLPPLREVNHNIPLIDASKHYTYHLPCCVDALKQQLSDKIWQYTDADWWIMKSIPQAAPMLCIPKKSGKLRAVKQGLCQKSWVTLNRTTRCSNTRHSW